MYSKSELKSIPLFENKKSNYFLTSKYDNF